MPKQTPDHHDADLLIKVYDLRREAVMRESRRAILRDFWPKSWEDLKGVLKPEHPLNASYRQVGTYFEMVYSFARHGIVHPEFWLENNGEGLFLFAKVEPFLAPLRETNNPVAFRNAEWIARECPDGKPVYARIQARRADGRRARLTGAVLPQPLRAVVLDFDGLILDTETPIYQAWVDAYRRHGHDLGLDLWEHSLGTHGAFDPLEHLGALVGGALDRDSLLAEVKADTARGCDAQGLMPGVERLLQDARALGLGRAVASSSSSGWVEGWLQRHGIHDLFDAFATRDQVARVKPDPELFLLAARKLGVPPQACVVFEDSANGMRAALAAGMRCVAVPNGLTRQLERPVVDLVVASLAEAPLAEILRRLEATPPVAGAAPV
jgi:putative hydrolase of the HAD superfamily